ncbi:MAG: hypothetical protein JNK77_08340 [Saprospiraceae bacterium]|nr:hypothetical protein [Saprospiraceae bacterium]
MTTLLTSKFTRLLQTFSPEELASFERWLQSAWCNTNKNLPRLLARLKPYYPDFSDQKLSKEKLFRQVLPDGKFSDRRMNNLLSEAYLAAERFLAFQCFAGEDGLQQSLLAQELLERHLDDWFFRMAQQEIKRLEAKETSDWRDHLELLRMLRRVYQHPDPAPRLESGQGMIAKMNEEIDLLYLLEKAALINEMITRNRLFKTEDHDVATALHKWRTTAEGIHHPGIDLYRLRFSYGGEVSLSRYQELQAAFMDNLAALNERDKKIHLLSLINDAKQLIKSGSLDITECLPLYQLGLTTGAILNNGKLSANTLMTIVTASNTKGTFDFSIRFVEDYSQHLNEKERDDCTHWAGAHTAYWQKDQEACLAILQGYHFHSPDFQLIGRVLAAQAYFDLHLRDDSYRSLLFDYLDAFEKWLGREKLWSKTNTGSFLRFVQICRSLARFYAGTGQDVKKTGRLLEDERNIQALNWLKQKKEEVLRLKS